MDEYLKYILWDPNYMGKDMYLMHHIGKHELTLGATIDILYIITTCLSVCPSNDSSAF